MLKSLVRRLLAFVRPREGSPRSFERSVAAAFDFLVRDYGFVRRPVERIAYEYSVDYESAAVQVTVQREIGQGPWVTLAAKQAPGWASRRGFGLHELEQELERAGRHQRRPAAPATIDESLALLAATLRERGDDVLRGDFSLLFERLRRHQDASGFAPDDVTRWPA